MDASWSRNDQSARRPPISRYRAATAPAPASRPGPHQAMHPRALMPGHVPQTIHTSDLSFTNATRSTSAHDVRSPPPPVPPHPQHSSTHIHFSLPPVPPLPPIPSTSSASTSVHRAMTAPPIPPKPPSRPKPHMSLSASSISPPVTTQASPTTNQMNGPPSDRDEDGLALALALSQSNARDEQKMRDKLSTQEEEDLARALKESLSFASTTSRSPEAMENCFAIASNNVSGKVVNSFFLGEDELSMMVQPTNDLVARDEALAFRIALEEAGTGVTPVISSPPAVRGTSICTTSTPSSPHLPSSVPMVDLPSYMDAVRPSTTPRSPSTTIPLAGDSKAGRYSIHMPQNAEPSHSRAGDNYFTSSHSLVRVSSASSLSGSQESEPETDPNPNPNVVNVNHFVDKQLFMGVSVGFFAPPISTDLIATLDVMPNIISLPYGKCPPLHLQGPDWRHLLKLMARLSGTRLEATLEAVAVSKSEMKLRTVIQFVKPLRTSSQWRTILYFTLDYPSPRSGDARQNVNTLPYSYSLSSIPTLLRDSSDTPVSKTFTIPASDAVPYPTLPITFPNLAMYLQAALEESRRYLNDSSSGNRKLAKMVQACYPSRTDDVLPDAPERSSVGGLLKRVIGRNTNKSTRTGGNEDTYELVTPFVPGEWG